MKKKYRIGEVAKIKDIDAQTLRYYDKLGLLSPEIIDKKNGYRYYSIEQFMDVDCIKFYRMIGFTLKEMYEFKEITDIEESISILKNKKDIFKEEIRKKQAILKDMEIIIQGIEDKSKLYKINGNNIEIKECKDIYGVIGECKTANDWFEFETKLGELTKRYPKYSEIGHNKDIILIYNYDILNRTNKEEMEFAGKILLPIHKKFMDDENVEKYPLGRCLVAYHKGSHESEGDLFKRIEEFIRDNKINIRGDIVVTAIINEFIINNPDEFLVEIKVPIV
ncbi:MerR family DNA-binding transcriptional regulator [Vallitalea maricola]|uniref:MerR family transcriptional regulator n=1 Tax=Vallitalea maricola TaxID=3074433 RepID=A0ACB5UK60_9FIRM|nr:MerR family transcriptional regulator [Vallitalea sp. AN17-2]